MHPNIVCIKCQNEHITADGKIPNINRISDGIWSRIITEKNEKLISCMDCGHKWQLKHHTHKIIKDQGIKQNDLEAMFLALYTVNKEAAADFYNHNLSNKYSNIKIAYKELNKVNNYPLFSILLFVLSVIIITYLILR